MILGHRVRLYRERLNLTLKKFEERSGVNLGTVSALETRPGHTSKFVVQIAAGLGLSVEQLLDETREWIDEHGQYVTDDNASRAKSRHKPRKWPFTAISEEAFEALSKSDKDRLDGALALAVGCLNLRPDSSGQPASRAPR